MTRIKGAPANRGKTISDAEFRRLWLDRRISCEEIGQRLGIGQSAVYYRAKARGLPDRKRAIPNPRIDHAALREMWSAGVLRADIAAYFGLCERMVTYYVSRNGLPARRGGHSSITLAEHRSRVLAERMVQVARAEQAAVAEHWKAAA